MTMTEVAEYCREHPGKLLFIEAVPVLKGSLAYRKIVFIDTGYRVSLWTKHCENLGMNPFMKPIQTGYGDGEILLSACYQMKK